MSCAPRVTSQSLGVEPLSASAWTTACNLSTLFHTADVSKAEDHGGPSGAQASQRYSAPLKALPVARDVSASFLKAAAASIEPLSPVRIGAALPPAASIAAAVFVASSAPLGPATISHRPRDSADPVIGSLGTGIPHG